MVNYKEESFVKSCLRKQGGRNLGETSKVKSWYDVCQLCIK